MPIAFTRRRSPLSTLPIASTNMIASTNLSSSTDLLIFDAMYSLGDTVSVKEHWGHSNNIVAVELAQAAQVKQLALFHHDPVLDDQMIENVLADNVRFEAIRRRGAKVDVLAAYDGLELTV